MGGAVIGLSIILLLMTITHTKAIKTILANINI